MRAVLATGLFCTMLVGCYTYRPLASVDTVMPAAGTSVQVRLTTTGATALANEIGPEMLYLQGDIVSADSAGVTLAVTHAETARRISLGWKGERVALPRDYIASIEQRKLAIGATALIGGLVGGGVIATAALFGTAGANSPISAPPTVGRQ